MSGTGVLFSYAIGLIFLVGGIVFLVALEDDRFLYGIPYTILGLLIVFGVHGVQRRARRRAREEAAAAEAEERKVDPA